MGEARLEREGSLRFSSRAQLRVARTRTRGDLELEADATTRAGRLGAASRFLFQAGPEGSRAGRVLSAGSTWSPPSDPGGIGLRLSLAAERSWAGQDTLRSLFDYARVAPSVEARRPLGRAGEVSLRAGLERKTAPAAAPGAYRGRWAEASWSLLSASRLRSDLRLRTESRTYERRGTLLPSYDEGSLQSDLAIPLTRRLELRVSPSLARAAYASDDSLVFRDHWTAEGVLRAERLFGGGGGPPGPWSGLEADWRAFLGVRAGWLRNERIRDADYRLASVLLGGAREATGSWWFDLSVEAGRRDYRGSGAGGAVVFEGFNISIRGSDYTFVSSSLLGEADLGLGLRLEIFVLWDQELHREEADDFSLWAGTVSLSRGF